MNMQTKMQDIVGLTKVAPLSRSSVTLLPTLSGVPASASSMATWRSSSAESGERCFMSASLVLFKCSSSTTTRWSLPEPLP